ncbi:MAG: hypothetical protein AABY00_03095 [Nanoarchaeota archaeon]
MHTSEVFPEYTLENAKELASLVRILFKSESFEEAVRAAVDEQLENLQEGRIHIFIPANTRSLTPNSFQELLASPKRYPLQTGEASSGPAIYGTKQSAFLGTTISGRNHSGFLVYDSAAAVIVDFVDRNTGKSLINPAIRQSYLSALEKELKYNVGWQEQVLTA